VGTLILTRQSGHVILMDMVDLVGLLGRDGLGIHGASSLSPLDHIAAVVGRP
jgi:hypothetical protein